MFHFFSSSELQTVAIDAAAQLLIVQRHTENSLFLFTVSVVMCMLAPFSSVFTSAC